MTGKRLRSYLNTWIIYGVLTPLIHIAKFANTKLKRFKSIFLNPWSKAIDAFTQNFENNWIVPSIHLITNSIHHLLLCKAEAILILPKWPSSSFCILLFRRNMKFVIMYWKSLNLHVSNICVFKGTPRIPFLALRNLILILTVRLSTR